MIATDEELEIGVFGIATKMVRMAQNVPDPEPAPALPYEPVPFNPEVPVPAPAASYALAYPGGRFPLRGGVTAIGRARECEIHLADPNVSRRHAEIHFDAGSYAVVDLGSTNGTELNGQRIKNARLSDGDVIAIGQTELTFVRE